MKENKQKKETWEKQVKDTKTRQYSFDTVSGKKNKLLYYPEKLDNSYFEKLGFPGQYPYTRGIHPNLYRGKLWTMRQFAGFGSPSETNQRFKLCTSG